MSDQQQKEEGGSPSARKALNVKTGAGAGFSAVSPGSPSKTKGDKDAKKEQIKSTMPTLFASKGSDDLYAIYDKFDTNINDLDKNLNSVLRKQEYEYLQAYNIYVKRKEKELRELIDALNEKNQRSNFKDLRISQLEVTIDQMRKDAYNYEQKMEQLQKDVKSWKEKHKMEIEEKEFYHKQALDAKRKNKLLKVAIGRLQNDLKKVEPEAAETPMIREEKEKDTDTFLTGANVDEYKEQDFNIESVENSQALVEQNLLKNAQVNRRRGVNQSFQSGRTSSVNTDAHKRAQSQGLSLKVSRYRDIPTENIKFQQFIDLIFESKMKKDDVKFEILNYVQALETNYNGSIQEQKVRNEKLKGQLRKEKSKNVNDVIERGDMENLFVDCVEDVRRNVIKRRLKAEIIGKKKIGKFDENSDEAKEFEDSLLKLANLAKDRVKFSEFTTQDRNNLLDLFVNNEKTLLKIYEILFPKKQNAQAQNMSRQISQLKNSSDTIKFGGRKSDFLQGNSSHQRSLDETQAATDLYQNSTILPSILPAMNSIQSNDVSAGGSITGGKSHMLYENSPGLGIPEGLLLSSSGIASNTKPSNLRAIHSGHSQNNQLAFQIGALNQKSQQMYHQNVASHASLNQQQQM